MLALADVEKDGALGKRRRRGDRLLVPPASGELSHRADDERSSGYPHGGEARGLRAGDEHRRVDRGGMDGTLGAAGPGDLPVGEGKGGGPREEGAREGVAADVPQVVNRPNQPRPGALPGEGAERVVVREVSMDDVEAFPEDRLAQCPRIPGDSGRAVRLGQERPRPSGRPETPGQGTGPHERELSLEAGVDEGLRPVADDGGDPGPLLAGDDVEDPHGEELSAWRVTDILRFGEGGGMAVDPELLAILVCPKTKGPLELVELKEATRKALVEKYREKFRDEEPVVTQGLYSKQADLVYPIVSDIPVMLVDEALPGSEAAGR